MNEDDSSGSEVEWDEFTDCASRGPDHHDMKAIGLIDEFGNDVPMEDSDIIDDHHDGCECRICRYHRRTKKGEQQAPKKRM